MSGGWFVSFVEIGNCRRSRHDNKLNESKQSPRAFGVELEKIQKKLELLTARCNEHNGSDVNLWPQFSGSAFRRKSDKFRCDMNRKFQEWAMSRGTVICKSFVSLNEIKL